MKGKEVFCLPAISLLGITQIPGREKLLMKTSKITSSVTPSTTLVTASSLRLAINEVLKASDVNVAYFRLLYDKKPDTVWIKQ